MYDESSPYHLTLEEQISQVHERLEEIIDVYARILVELEMLELGVGLEPKDGRLT